MFVFEKKDYWRFGLNQNVKIKNFKFEKGLSKNNQEYIALILEVEKEGVERNMNQYYFPPKKLFNTKLQEGTEEYKKALEQEEIAWATDILTLAMDICPEKRQQLVSIKANTIEEFAKKFNETIGECYKNGKYDLFLQYQYSIKQGNDQTYLEIPRRRGRNAFIIPTIEGDFEEIRTDDKLEYIDRNKKVKHPFKRDKRWLSSKVAKKQYRNVDTGLSLESDNIIETSGEGEPPF